MCSSFNALSPVARYALLSQNLHAFAQTLDDEVEEVERLLVDSFFV
jgi:hypothetical protein